MFFSSNCDYLIVWLAYYWCFLSRKWDFRSRNLILFHNCHFFLLIIGILYLAIWLYISQRAFFLVIATISHNCHIIFHNQCLFFVFFIVTIFHNSPPPPSPLPPSIDNVIIAAFFSLLLHITAILFLAIKLYISHFILCITTATFFLIIVTLYLTINIFHIFLTISHNCPFPPHTWDFISHNRDVISENFTFTSLYIQYWPFSYNCEFISPQCDFISVIGVIFQEPASPT